MNNKTKKEAQKQAGLDVIESMAAYLEVDARILEAALQDAAAVVADRIKKIKAGR